MSRDGTASRRTSRAYRRPHRPFAVALANRLAPPVRLDPEAWLDALGGARAFADRSFVEPLGRLTAALEDEAALTPVGRLLVRARLRGTLAARLRAERCLADRPEIEAMEVPRPIVITGLQRTGTTLLHRLMAADPARRALASWEALSPAPPEASLGDRLLAFADRRLGVAAGGRLTRALAAEGTLRYLAPDFFAVHPVRATAPEEDVMLLDMSFLSTVGEASHHVPSYARWLERQDHRPAYRWLRRMLQLLQWQRPGRPARWVLKTPHHLEHLDALHAVFPDVRVVQTHRDPVEAVASFCSMVAHGRGIFSDRVDPEAVGQHWLDKIARMTARAAAYRRAHPELPALDLRYEALTAEPLAAVERVYALAGDALSAAGRSAMERWLSADAPHRFGRHVYALRDFGLDAPTVRERLAHDLEAMPQGPAVPAAPG